MFYEWLLIMSRSHANACRKTSLEIHFIYLGNKENLLHFYDMLHNLCFIFHKYCLFNYVIFFCSNNTLFINCVLKVKCAPQYVKGEILLDSDSM